MAKIIGAFCFAALLVATAYGQVTKAPPIPETSEVPENETASNLTGRFLNIFGYTPPVSEQFLANNPFGNILQLIGLGQGSAPGLSPYGIPSSLQSLWPFLLSQGNLTFSDLLLLGIFNGGGIVGGGGFGGNIGFGGNVGFGGNIGCRCGRNAWCYHQLCRCRAGYTGNPYIRCYRRNQGNNQCSNCFPPYYCLRQTYGGYQCTCPPGQYCPPQGSTCNRPCGSGSTCQFGVCVCKQGYIKISGICVYQGQTGNCYQCYPPYVCRPPLLGFGPSVCTCPTGQYCPPTGNNQCNPACIYPRVCTRQLFGGYECTCPTGQYCPPTFPTCNPSCGINEECQGGFCNCKSGYTRIGGYCVYQGTGNNQCNPACIYPRVCIRQFFGGYTCTCPTGQYCPPTGSTCNPPCGSGGNCQGGVCVCKSGYSWNGLSCVYQGTGSICNPPCKFGSTCQGFSPYSTCVCNSGYTQIGNDCVYQGTSGGCSQCYPPYVCTPNYSGGYECTCPSGQYCPPTGAICNPPCTLPGAICQGGFLLPNRCVCKPEYISYGNVCLYQSQTAPSQQCNPACDTTANCLPGNTLSGYECKCKDSTAQWNGVTCLYRSASIGGNGCTQTCEPTATCIGDAASGFRCECKQSGYVWSSDLATCVLETPSGTCAEPCGADAYCNLNADGSYQCVCFDSNYIWDVTTCIPKPVASPVCSLSCGENAYCQINPSTGAEECKCSVTNQVWNGSSCSDPSPCNPGCPANAACHEISEGGGHQCICLYPYVKEGSQCVVDGS